MSSQLGSCLQVSHGSAKAAIPCKFDEYSANLMNFLVFWFQRTGKSLSCISPFYGCDCIGANDFTGFVIIYIDLAKPKRGAPDFITIIQGNKNF